MAKEFIPLFLDFNETTQDLTDEQCGRLIRALVDYTNGRKIDLDGMELLAFRFLKGSIDRNEKLSAIRAQAGSKGGKQRQANASKDKQNVINNNNDINSKNKNDINNRFDRFWTAYPRHVAKQEALKRFEKLNPSEELLETMLKAIEKQKGSDQWTRDNGQYIPYPSSWLNQSRWEDELPTSAPGKIVTAQGYSQRGYEDEDSQAMERMLRLV